MRDFGWTEPMPFCRAFARVRMPDDLLELAWAGRAPTTLGCIA